ncbi:MAG TPA: hypothetical protein VLH19_03045, partial [Patescibacteria group bacterium]|nr:hypothetical protein [Patescibacteria group bacterium]
GQAAATASEVLFAFPDAWANGETIKNEKKHLLKSITTQLNLKSVGFVVLHEAMLTKLKEHHGTGISTILVQVEEKIVNVVIARQGEVSAPTEVARSSDIVADLKEALTRNSAQSLPTRIEVLSLGSSQADLATLTTTIQAIIWEKNLFSQPPTVKSLGTKEILEAIATSGGREVAKALGVIGEEKQEIPVHDTGFGFVPIEQSSAQTKELEVEDEPVRMVPQAKSQRSFKKVGILLGAVIALLVILGAGTVFAIGKMVSVRIDLIPKSQPVSEEVTLTVDSTVAQCDPAKSVLKADVKAISVNGSKTVGTTGKKIIGDKAKGTIQLFNKTFAAKSFTAGTQVSDGNLKYTLDDSVTVASASAASYSTTTNGETDVNITAVDFGTSFNLPKDSEFAIATYDKSAFVGAAKTDIAGGSSRTIQAVSDQDYTDLTGALLVDLKVQAKDQLSQSIESGQDVIISDQVTLGDKQFSGTVGQEAKDLTLSMSVQMTGLVYSKEDLTTLLQDKVSTTLAQGVVLQKEKTTLDILDQKILTGNKAQIHAKISTVSVPTIDTAALGTYLAGKDISAVQGYLNAQSGIESHTIEFTPSFAAGFLHKLPDSSHLHIFVKSI